MGEQPTNLPAGRRILVTGGTGFIGQRLVRRLVDVGCEVICTVRPTSATEFLQSCGVQLITAELNDRDGVQQAIAAAKPAVVVHVAGCVRARRADEFRQVNVQGTDTIAAACAACDAAPVLVVVSSLAAVGPSADDVAHTEAVPPRPVSTYGSSKHEAERVAAAYAGDLPITIVRPPIVFGPGDRGVLQMMRPIARYGVHAVPQAGTFRLSMLHVDDLVHGLLRVMVHGERIAPSGPVGCGVYFMAEPEQPSYAELGQMMGRAMDRAAVRTLRLPPTALKLAGRLGDVVSRLRGEAGWINSDKVRESLAGSWTCCSDKASEQLDWRPSQPLEHRLRDTAWWYREAGWLGYGFPFILEPRD